MAVSPTKKTTRKTPVKKAAPAKKKAPAKKTTARRSTKPRKMSAEERYRMTEVAAYYIAEHNGFKGNPVDFWIAAEEEISKQLD